MERLPARGLIALCLALLLVLGCKGRKSTPAAVSAVLPPPPPPVGLLAELSIPTPAATYQVLRGLGGGAVQGLPASPELSLAAALELPPLVAGALMLDRALVGAAVTTEGDREAIVLGCRVRSGEELVLALTSPEGGGRTATRDPKTGLTELSGAGNALGVVGDWLVVSNAAPALRSAGPYVARTLGARPPTTEAVSLEVPEVALEGAFVAAVKARWVTSRHVLSELASQARASAGRPPDFGRPEAILEMGDRGVGTLVDYLKSCRRARLTLALEASGGAELAVTLDARPNGVLAQAVGRMQLGGFEPLLDLPRDSSQALLVRSGPVEPNAPPGESPFPQLVEALGPELGAKDKETLSKLLRELGGGLSGSEAVARRPTGVYSLRLGVRDAASVERAMPALVKILSLPSLREPLEKLVGKVALREETKSMTGVPGKAHRIVVAPPRAPDQGFEIWWAIDRNALLVVLGPNPSLGLGLLADPVAASKLGSRPEIAAMAARRTPSSLAALLDVAPPGASVVSAPLMLAVGARDGSARGELAVSSAALGVILKGMSKP